ncbi:MAG: hypothetical protein ABFS35_16365 [Bacteroidota bacterium]
MFLKSKAIILLFLGAFFLYSCEEFNLEPEDQAHDQPFPAEVKLELPSAISSDELLKSLKVLSGRGIHNYLRNFVYIGDEIAGIFNSTYQRIIAIDVEGASEFSYTGLDGNTKHVSIKESVDLENIHWDYYMEIYDDSFSNLALQAFWNDQTPEQLIILKPNQLNHYRMEDHPETMVILEYLTEVSAAPYESSVYVGISGLTTSEQNPYAPNNMKLFFGVNNQIIDFIGSSNNPNVTLYDTRVKGNNWSFRGKADLAKNLAVTELALVNPELKYVENIMEDFSLKNVLLQELRSEYNYDGFTDEEIFADKDIDISTIESPAFFNSEGFQSSGTNTSAEYSHLTDFSNLIPFIPLAVKNYEVAFVNFLE